MGLKLYGDQNNRMHNVVGVYIPEGIDGERIRHIMLLEFGIEIGTSFWSAERSNLAHRHHGLQRPTGCGAQTLACLEQCLLSEGFKLPPGAAVAEARQPMLPPPFLDREMTATDMKPQFQIEKSVRKRLFKTSAERLCAAVKL
ncbi:MAG: hypothetical protein CM15mP120_04320 [Pseudomonadota bacterium]|nr:MAG: hypothetical protein CM15mP120_04320 [Pseudomonadota bacterium]